MQILIFGKPFFALIEEILEKQELYKEKKYRKNTIIYSKFPKPFLPAIPAFLIRF